MRFENDRETEIDSTETIAEDEGGFFRFPANDYAGIYGISVGTQPEPLSIAVNVPATTPGGTAESDLRRMTLTDLQRPHPTPTCRVVTDAKRLNKSEIALVGYTLQRSTRSRGPAVARVLLLLLLGCLLLEVFLGMGISAQRVREVKASLTRRVCAAGVGIACCGGCRFC